MLGTLERTGALDSFDRHSQGNNQQPRIHVHAVTSISLLQTPEHRAIGPPSNSCAATPMGWLLYRALHTPPDPCSTIPASPISLFAMGLEPNISLRRRPLNRCRHHHQRPWRPFSPSSSACAPPSPPPSRPHVSASSCYYSLPRSPLVSDQQQ